VLAGGIINACHADITVPQFGPFTIKLTYYETVSLYGFGEYDSLRVMVIHLSWCRWKMAWLWWTTHLTI